MKTTARTPYPAECKREAWAMVARSEQTLPEVARALGLSRSALGRWRREQWYCHEIPVQWQSQRLDAFILPWPRGDLSLGRPTVL